MCYAYIYFSKRYSGTTHKNIILRFKMDCVTFNCGHNLFPGSPQINITCDFLRELMRQNYWIKHGLTKSASVNHFLLLLKFVFPSLKA